MSTRREMEQLGRNGLSVELGPLHLPYPIINASGTMELFALAEAFGHQILERPPVAAYVPKTVTLQPRAGNPPPRILETSGGMVNAIGLSSEGLDAFLADRLPGLLGLPCPILLSIGGFSLEEYVALAAGIRGALDSEGRAVGVEDVSPCVPGERPVGSREGRQAEGTAGDPACERVGLPSGWTERVGLELNISCPNVHSGCLSIGTDCHETREVVAAVRAVWPGLLVAKLTPNVTDIVEVAQAAVAGGASALALVNTYKGMVLDRTTLKPYLGNMTGGLSGPAIKPLALRAVYEVYSAVDVPIIGMGGVTNALDALEFISCGATVVSVGSALLRDPWLCERMAADLEAELESRSTTLADLLGRAHR